MRDIKFTFEEIVEICEPSNPLSGFSNNGTVDRIKTVTGIATLDDSGEVKDFDINDIKIDNRKVTEGLSYSYENRTRWLDVFKKLFSKSR